MATSRIRIYKKFTQEVIDQLDLVESVPNAIYFIQSEQKGTGISLEKLQIRIISLSISHNHPKELSGDA